jgi:hypothetical protein
MELLDPFSRTFLPAVEAARIPFGAANKHVDVLRRCAGDRDHVVQLAMCHRSHQPLARGRQSHLLMLTRHRLVVTTFSPVLRKLRLCLNAELHHLTDVTWTAEPAERAVQLAVTAIDGGREHFWIRLGCDGQLARLDDVLTEAFRGPWVAPRKAALKLAA